ncbi:hypothetical protein Y032_0117g655 [Ancylostoma ceylanicum]|nr:hypothetical protein Y032_0117g655 [Ancylostoma ceylanicum]
MVLLVMLSYMLSINPDNVATPLAASFGDLLTIGLLIGVAIVYHPFASISFYIPVSVVVCFVSLVPFWIYVAHHDERAWIAARQQGPTFLLASILSSGAGIIQAHGLKSFPELTVYQPLITGVAGNRASLQSARISSYVNTYKGADKLAPRLNPWTYYTSPDEKDAIRNELRKYGELHTAVDKGRYREANTLANCCTSRASGKSQRNGLPPCLCPAVPLPRCSKYSECPRRGPALVHGRFELTVSAISLTKQIICYSESRAALLILLTSPPYHAFFVSVSHIIAYFALKPLKLSFIFLAGYMCAVFVQIFFLVYVAQIVVYCLYHFRIDPDMHAIPLVTAIGDLVGTALLLSLFYVMSYGDDFVLKSTALSETPTNTTLCSYE